MLARSVVKTPLIVLLAFSLLAQICLLAGIVQSGIGGYIGILMQQSTILPCSYYLKFKVETLNTYMYNIIFFCDCGAAAVSAAFLILLVKLVLKLVESENQQFPEFTLNNFYLLYILYSLAILLAIPGAGFYLTLLIQKGNACLGSYQFYWFRIGGAFVLALIFLLICWIYLFILKIHLQDRFEDESFNQQNFIKIPQQVMIQPTMGNFLDLILMQQRLKDKQKPKTEIKQPLIAEVDSDDQVTLQEGEKEKITCIGFRQYIRKQQIIKIKEEEQQRIIEGLIAIQKSQRELVQKQNAQRKEKQRKSRLLNMALSPDHEDIDQIFQQSEKQEKNLKSPGNSQKSAILNQPFYPANYVPIDEQDQKKFKQYKKKLLSKYNIQKIKNHKRHLQNIEGGRSRHQIQCAVNAHKKPPRTVQYYENLLKSSDVSPIQQIKDSGTYSSEQGDRQSAIIKNKQAENVQKIKLSQTVETREQPSIMVPNYIDPHQADQDNDEQKKQHHGILLFRKRANKSPTRKILFEQQTNYLKSLNMGSVLGTLVKGVVQTTHHSRLMRLRQQRNAVKDPFYTSHKKSEKILEFIRSKYS